MERKRLLLVTTVPETFCMILQGQPNYLNQHFTVLIATSPGQGFESLHSREEVAVYSLPMERGVSPFRDALSIFRMVLLLLRLRPDIVHSYTPKAGLVAMLAAYLCRVPVRIHTFTGLIFPTRTGLGQQVLIWIDRLICACATRVVPEGEGVKKDLQRFRITAKPLQLIGQGNIAGVDTAFFSPETPGLKDQAKGLLKRIDGSGSGNAFVFCFIGRLNRDKGLAELAGAFSELPENAHLLLVGAVDQAAPVDARSLSLLQAHLRVHLLGFQADIRPALLCADVLVLPSYREGFSNVILQAGAMRLPVIATDIAGCNEVIEPAYNGWLVPARDAQALQDAMRAVMSKTREELEATGKRARRRIQERFEQRLHWRRMVAFYDKEIAVSSRRSASETNV